MIRSANTSAGSPPPVSGVGTTGLAYRVFSSLELVAGQPYLGSNLFRDGIGTGARLQAEQVTGDGTSLYVASRTSIKKINPATGAVTSLAGRDDVYHHSDGIGAAATFYNITGLTAVGGYLYVTDYAAIRKVSTADGTTTTFAGQGLVFGDVDATGSAARFHDLSAITNDGTALYVVDHGSRKIKKIALATGTVTTLAGSGVHGTSDGTGTAAQLSWVKGITRVGALLYFIDNQTALRSVHSSSGVVTTLNSNIGYYCSGLTTDGADLYCSSESETLQGILKIELTGYTATAIAGQYRFWGDIDGIGSAASFSEPASLTWMSGLLYVADTGNGLLRSVNLTTFATQTVAGVSDFSNYGYKDATGGLAKFNPLYDSRAGATPDGVNYYLADTLANTIRKINLVTGAVTTFAGSPGIAGSTDGTGSSARFNYPNSVTTDGTSLFVTEVNNKIRKIAIATGAVTTLTVASLGTIIHATSDGTTLYVYDGNRAIHSVHPVTGASTFIAGGTYGNADGVGAAAQFSRVEQMIKLGSYLYVTDDNCVRRIDLATGTVLTIAGGPSGTSDGIGAAARFSFVEGIATDGTDLYVSSFNDGRIVRINLANNQVTTIAEQQMRELVLVGGKLIGTNGQGKSLMQLTLSDLSFNVIAGHVDPRSIHTGRTDGVAATARFEGIGGIATDGTDLFIVDGHRVRKWSRSNGTLTTIAGSASGSADGIGTSASFYYPNGIAYANGRLYISDTYNYTIRELNLSNSMVTTFAGTAGSSGSLDGIGTAAGFSGVSSIVTDGTYLYAADSGNCVIRKIHLTTAAVSTIAGTVGTCAIADGTGAGASFDSPNYLAIRGTALYVTDNTAIRKLDLNTLSVTTLAGVAGSSLQRDGIGTAATFSYLGNIQADDEGLYIADSGANALLRLQFSTLAVTTVFSSPQNDSPGPLSNGSTQAGSLFTTLLTSEGLYFGSGNLQRFY